MERLSGVAKMVRRTAEVSGNQDGVGTSQGVTFRIDNRSAEMWSPTAPQIEDGDEISIAGDVADGVLKGRAYMNHSSGAGGRRANWSIALNFLFYAIGGFFLTVVAVMVLGTLLGIGPLGLLAYPIVWVSYAISVRDELKNRRAVRLVRSAMSPAAW